MTLKARGILYVTLFAFFQATAIAQTSSSPMDPTNAAINDLAESPNTKTLLATDEPIKVELNVLSNSNSPYPVDGKIEVFAGTLQLMDAHAGPWDWIHREISKSRAADKNAKVVAIVDSSDHDQPDSGEVLLTSAEKAEINVKPWQRGLIILTRLVVSGGSTFLTLYYVKHMGHQSLDVALQAGTMSALYALTANFQSRYIGRSFVSDPRFLGWLKAKNISIPRTVIDKLEIGEALAKYFTLEVPFVLVLNFAEWRAAQAGPFTEKFATYVSHDLVQKFVAASQTASKAVLSQGIAEAGLSKETEDKIEKTSRVSEIQSLRRRLMLELGALSAASVGTAAIDTMGPLTTFLGFKITAASIVFALLAAVGLGNFIRVQKKIRNSSLDIKTDEKSEITFNPNLNSDCRDVFKRVDIE